MEAIKAKVNFQEYMAIIRWVVEDPSSNFDLYFDENLLDESTLFEKTDTGFTCESACDCENPTVFPINDEGEEVCTFCNRKPAP